jgi:peptidyl-prolyl cis-trans isomerase SurA
MMDGTMKRCVYVLAVRGWLAAALIGFAAMVAPQTAQAQVIVLVNGSPITALDIEQRIKLDQVTNNKATPRQQAINELIDDKIKLSIAKRYGYEIGDSDVTDSYANMARRARMNVDQLGQMLTARGTSAGAFKAKIRADMTWQQIVRSKFSSTLQVGESDVSTALQTRTTGEKEDVGHIYTLYPVIMIIPSGVGEAATESRRREAENLRTRFQNCGDGLKLARALRDVAVREPISRSSADLPEPLRELLSKMELGRLTTPEITAQGLQMFALCEKKESGSDSPAKREAREEIFTKRFEAESKKWLEELRRQAMIEYR